MNCEHETFVGDNDLFQMLIAEYKLAKTTEGAGYIYLLEEHVEEYLPKMNDVFALQVINFLLSEIKEKRVQLETTGNSDFYFLNSLEKWYKLRDVLVEIKNGIMESKDSD